MSDYQSEEDPSKRSLHQPSDGKSHSQKLARQRRRRQKDIKAAEDHHQGRITLEVFNHAVRRYLGNEYPDIYPQWVLKNLRRRLRRPRCDRRSATAGIARRKQDWDRASGSRSAAGTVKAE
ncbi:MAG: hypothetical protein L6R37_005990 [Teloschistes peruensis]|nr:MAG: hypothetical protein L6R37_005990 [Teloschistes peruensis]